MRTHPGSEELTAWMLHTLPIEPAAIIARHLRVCRPCRQELATLRETLGLYASLLTVTASNAPGRERLLGELTRLQQQIARKQQLWITQGSHLRALPHSQNPTQP